MFVHAAEWRLGLELWLVLAFGWASGLTLTFGLVLALTFGLMALA